MKNIEKSSKISKLSQILDKGKIAYVCDCSFKKLTTMGCGGNIALAVFPNSTKKLLQTLKTLHKLAQEYLILGKGSNIVASDEYFEGVVVCTANVNKTKRQGNVVTADCGVHTVVLANFLAQANLCGGEFLFCLPATVGGAAVMNAGCFSCEMQNIVQSVTVLDKNGRIRRVTNSQCKFGYRSSIFQDDGSVVLKVRLKLQAGNKDEISARMKQMMDKKLASQPLGAKSCGCVFYNDDRTASKLIDDAQQKGRQIGQACVSTKHAGFVLNVGNATSCDVLQLIVAVRDSVEQKFGQKLKTEVKFVGFGAKKL